jgi:hypothetical protein
MKNIKPEKEYYIRIFITDMKNESITGLLGWGPIRYKYDWGHWITIGFDQARNWGSRENVLHEINKIINEQQIQRICNNVNKNVDNTNDIIKFRLSVVELDINDITIKELDYFCGMVSNNQITITDKGVSEEEK